MQVTECPFSNGSLGTNKTKKIEDSLDFKSDVIMDELPGPSGPPVIGQYFKLDTDNMHLQFMEWQKIHGDIFMFKIFGQPYIVISHPDILRDMFITCEHANILNDRPTSFTSKYVIDNKKDIVFRKCDEKQQILKMASLNYIEEELLEEKWFYEQVLEECKDFNDSLASLTDAPVDLPQRLDKIGAKVVALLLLGRRVKDDDPAFICLCEFMEAGNEMAKVKNQTILTKFPGMRKVPGHLKDIYDSITTAKQKVKEHFITENKSQRGLVAKLQQLSKSLEQDGEASWLDKDFILGVTMDLTAAAVVPLQNTLSSLFLVLIHYPLVQERIRKEVKSMTSQVTIDDVTKLPYCSACMLEIKRYHTPLAISARHCNLSADAKFESYHIPRKTEIFSNLFGMHHDERFWSDPWRFKPERFLTAAGDLLREDHPNMRNLVVTGVGPRRCVGSKFAENVMFLMVTSILKRFHVRPSDTEGLPPCDPRQFLSGVVIRAPNYKCVMRETDQIARTPVVKQKHAMANGEQCPEKQEQVDHVS